MFAFAFEISIRILFLALVAQGVVWCLRKRSAASRHIVWCGALIGMLLMPLSVYLLPSLPLRLLPGPAATVSHGAINITPLRVTPVPETRVVVPARPAPSSPNLPAMLYVAIAALLIVRLLITLLRRRALIRRSVPIPREEVWMPAVARVRLVESSDVLVPSVTGWKLPEILLPVTWREWDRSRFDAVFAHEMAHIVRRDTVFALLAAVNKAVFWFHPASWWLEKRLASAAEEASDDVAIETVGDARSYARSLVEIASVLSTRPSQEAWAGAAMASSSKLGDRVRRLLDDRYRPPVAAPIPLRVACGIAGTIAIIAISLVSLERRIQAQPPMLGAQLSFPDFGMTPETAAELERQLAQYPKDLPTRIRLLIYYGSRKEAAQAWLTHALWMIRNDPSNPIVAAQPGKLPFTGEVKPVLARAWTEAADLHSSNAAVLQNVGRAFQTLSEYTRAELYYKRARLLQNNPGALIAFYGYLITSVERQAPGITPEHVAFVDRAKADLMGSNDAEVVGGVGRALGVQMQQPLDYPWRDKDLPVRLLQRAAALAPNDERWGRELEALRNPISTSRLLDAGPLKPVQMVPPVYPPLARQARIQGQVRFDLVVAEDGSVQDIRLLSGHPLLVQAAQEAVKQWKFEPQRLNGQPFKARTIANVPFEIAAATSGAPGEFPVLRTLVPIGVAIDATIELRFQVDSTGSPLNIRAIHPPEITPFANQIAQNAAKLRYTPATVQPYDVWIKLTFRSNGGISIDANHQALSAVP